jgi:hypothetical protein
VADPLSPDLQMRIQSLAAKGRDELELHLFGRPRGAGWRIMALRAFGAVAIGILAAGMGIFATVVVLNLVFHYVPT